MNGMIAAVKCLLRRKDRGLQSTLVVRSREALKQGTAGIEKRTGFICIEQQESVSFTFCTKCEQRMRYWSTCLCKHEGSGRDGDVKWVDNEVMIIYEVLNEGTRTSKTVDRICVDHRLDEAACGMKSK